MPAGVPQFDGIPRENHTEAGNFKFAINSKVRIKRDTSRFPYTVLERSDTMFPGLAVNSYRLKEYGGNTWFKEEDLVSA